MKKYALVVGVSTYADPEITDLPLAAHDAEEVGQCLRDTCEFDEVRTLTSGGDCEPEHVNVVDALYKFAPLLSPADMFLFYFAGHGIETKLGAHLLTCNARIRMPELASISTDMLRDCLSSIECADRVLIVDACRNDPYSGRGDCDNRLNAAFSRDILAVAETPVEGVVPTTCVLFSCGHGERAYEWPDKGHGAYTHYLLEGLRGAAAADHGGITVQSLGRYVERMVVRWAKKTGKPRPQTPWSELRGSLREITLSLPERVKELTRQDLGRPATESHPERLRTGSPCADAFPPQLETRPVISPPARNPAVRLPDMLQPVADAKYAPLDGLYVGSEEAQQRQREWVEKGFPLEVMMKKTGIVFRLVPPGEFIMGASTDNADAWNDESPQHSVTVASPLYVAKYPLTQEQWLAVVASNPSAFQSGPGHPIDSISWNDCHAFLSVCDFEFGRGLRLPTESEWEYACRAGTTDDRYGTLDAIGWYVGNSGGMTHPVGEKLPNAWGLFDMLGNVWEWCADWYANSYAAKKESSSRRVVRGGGWRSKPRICRSARRYYGTPDYACDDLSFRIVVDL